MFDGVPAGDAANSPTCAPTQRETFDWKGSPKGVKVTPSVL